MEQIKISVRQLCALYDAVAESLIESYECYDYPIDQMIVLKELNDERLIFTYDFYKNGIFSNVEHVISFYPGTDEDDISIGDMISMYEDSKDAE